jgi:hypothetical protein
MDHLIEYVAFPLLVLLAIGAGWVLKIWWLAGPLVAGAAWILFEGAEVRWATALLYGALAAFATHIRRQQHREG